MKVTLKKPILDILNRFLHKDWGKQYAEIKSLATKEEILSFQKERLEKLLAHAYHNVPYYNKLFRDYGIASNDRVDLARFNEIPILTKDIIKRHQKELISRDYKTRRWYFNSTGGSTGEPITFIQDNVYDRWDNAVFYYYYKDILGIDEPSVKKAILWGSERDIFQGGMGWIAKIVNWLNNTVFLNSFKMTPEDMDRYLDIINSYQPHLIRGYASSLFELCRHAERKGGKIHAPELVISSAERLSGEMRGKIEKVFGAKVYDFYGSREINNLSGECREGLMHILAFHNYVEILDDNNQPVKEGELGRVIVTNLHNYSMPFIRYEVGDMAVLGPKRCQCGNILPTLGRVTGRITDHFVKEDRTIIHGEYFTHLFYLKDWVASFQVIQEDYRRIKILVVLKENINEPEKKDIEDKIRLIMGQDCQLIWDFVDEIPATPEGKYLYTKSLVRR
jgi:phenylacetate-CoA ligase